MNLIEGETYRFKTKAEMDKDLGLGWEKVFPVWIEDMNHLFGKEFVMPYSNSDGTFNIFPYLFDQRWVHTETFKWVDIKPPLKGL